MTRKELAMGKKALYLFCFLLILAIGGIVFLYFTNEGVANEFRQVRQPNPNRFFVGIDVSATIDPDTLDDFKSNVTSRLKNFVGDEAVAYNIASFGNPGCGKESIVSVVSTQSPKDQTAFKYEVEKKLQTVSPATESVPGKPLTTPLYCLMKQVLTEWVGGRIIIFSDVMNDDSDCTEQFVFPEKEITNFGANRNGQIIFIHPTPRLTSTPDLNRRIMKRQQKFISKMEDLFDEGIIRTEFHHIPDDPVQRRKFMKDQLERHIPSTTFEIVKERVSRMMHTIVSAVRG